MLHHCQLTFYEQAFRPVAQENLSFVEQAEKPVADNDARYQIDCQLTFYEQASCLFHNKIDLLWNRPKSLLLTMVQDIGEKL